MREVLFVSKPVRPPWNDGSKNIVRDLTQNLSAWRGSLLTPGLRRGQASDDEAARRSSRFAPSVAENAEVFLRLMMRRRPDLVHFVFAPNWRSSRAGRLAVRSRRFPSVHTAASAPRVFDSRLLFADRTVVLSRDTEHRFLNAGVPRERLERIPAPLGAVPTIGRDRARAVLALPTSVPVLLFPGDLERGGGAETVLAMALALPVTDFVLVMACRRKTRASETMERSLRVGVRRLPAGREVRWVGETPKIHEFLAASDLALLPATSLVGKTDHPLVLLEAMAHGVPLVVGEAGPFSELVDDGGAVSCVAEGEALAECVATLLADAEARRRMSASGRAYVEREHAAAAVAARYEALYERVWSAR